MSADVISLCQLAGPAVIVCAFVRFVVGLCGDKLVGALQAARVECPVACQAACPAVCPTWAEQAHQQVAPQAAQAPRLRRSTKSVTPHDCVAPSQQDGLASAAQPMQPAVAACMQMWFERSAAQQPRSAEA